MNFVICSGENKRPDFVRLGAGIFKCCVKIPFFRSGPQPGKQQASAHPPKFFKTCLIVRYNKKLQKLCPPIKYQLVAALFLFVQNNLNTHSAAVINKKSHDKVVSG